MSNRGEPWRKFVQTFFLAEQPNGYFVLNDIFRFLKEETVESDEETGAAEPTADSAPAPVESTSVPQAPVLDPVPSIEDTSAPVEVAPEEPAPVPEPEPEPVPAVEAAPAQNGHAEPEEKEEVEATPAPELAPTEPEQPAVAASPSPAPEPEPALAAASPAPSTPAAAPSPAPATPSPAPPAQAPAPQPTAPPVPKTWANLAAANSKKWGSAVAQESRGTSEVPAASSSIPPVTTHSPGPAGRGPPHGARGDAHPAYVAAQNIPTAQCFVKVCFCLSSL